MKLSILGSGRVAYSVARRAIAASHQIVIGTRDPSKIDREKWLELPSVKFASISEAGLGDVVLLAVPWEHVDHVLEQIPTWDRRILIDATNPFILGTPPRLLDLGGQNASLLYGVYPSITEGIITSERSSLGGSQWGPIADNIVIT